MGEAPTLSVPVHSVLAACSVLALETLSAWMEAGAVLKDEATVSALGNRIMAHIGFESPITFKGQTSDAYAVPLVVTLYDGEAGADMLARVKAGDDLVDRLREQLATGAAA